MGLKNSRQTRNPTRFSPEMQKLGTAGIGWYRATMYDAGKKTGKTDNDVMVDEIVKAAEERAEELARP